MDSVVVSIETAPHEFAANYVFSEYGLQPFFAADSIVKQAGGATEWLTFNASGEQWLAKLHYQQSGIVHPGDRTPTGTDWQLDEMREFRLKVKRHPDEDDAGQQSFNAHIAPRWTGMEAERSDGKTIEISIPDGLGEGINIRVNGSDIEFTRYESLLRKAAGTVGINQRYFDQPHPFSNIQDAERYVRLHKDRSGPIHARTGPIASLAHLLENDRDGYRKIVQNDRDEDGQTVPGYYHTVTLGQRRVQEAFPSHILPKEVKHYYACNAANMDTEQSLAHPKLGASYQVSRWDKNLGVNEEDLARLDRELEETVLSVLADAGLPIRQPDAETSCTDRPDPFVSDAYFDSEATGPCDRNVVDLGLTKIRQDQESVVIRHICDGLSPVEWESLQTLIADGGEVSPADIAVEHDRHVDSVRRALDRIPDLIEREYGNVALRSTYIAELVHEAVEEAKDATRRAVEVGAKAMEVADRGVDEKSEALIAWAARHGVDVDDSKDVQLFLRMGSVDNVEGRINEAYRLWCDSGRDPHRFRSAQIDLGERGFTTAWRWL